MIEGIVISNGAGQSPNTFNSSVITPTPIKMPKTNSLVASIANQASMLTSHTLNAITSTVSNTNSSSNSSSHHSLTIDWTHDRIIKLIQLYEKKSVLWNPSNPEYFHRDIRNMVYDDLVRELNIENLTVNETKRKLENLRSYFRRETKKLQDHERKTGEKLHSKWPYYDCLHFICEFMSVKNEGGSETGFAKNVVRSTYLPTMNIKTEATIPNVSEECAVQVPLGSTSLPDNSFNLGSQDLVAVLKALQGPLAEQAALCFANSLSTADLQQQVVETTKSPPICGSITPTNSASPKVTDIRISEVETGNHTPGSVSCYGNIEKPETDSRTKKRRLRYGSDSENTNEPKEADDLCSDYGKTIAHQLRQIDDRKRDLIRLQIDQLIFDAIHKSDENSKPDKADKETNTTAE